MNKEEILEKSRREKEDEGVVYALNKGHRYGAGGMHLMMCVLLLFNLWQAQDNSAILALLCAYNGFNLLGNYRVLKKRSQLVIALLCLLAGALACAAYFYSVLQ